MSKNAYRVLCCAGCWIRGFWKLYWVEVKDPATGDRQAARLCDGCLRNHHPDIAEDDPNVSIEPFTVVVIAPGPEDEVVWVENE